MLIEAAKGGHTGVVSVLIDYNPNNLDPSGDSGGVIPPGVSGPASTDTSAIEVSGEVVQCDTVAAVTAVTNTNSNPSGGPVPEDSLIPLTRFPAEGHEGHEGQQGNCPFRFHVIPCRSVSFHVIPCHSMSIRVIQFHSMSFRVIPCQSVSFRVIPCHSISFHVIPRQFQVILCHSFIILISGLAGSASLTTPGSQCRRSLSDSLFRG